MSEEIAKGDSAAEESALNGDAASVASVAEGPEHAPEPSTEPVIQEIEEFDTLLKEVKMEFDISNDKIAGVTVTVDRETDSPVFSPMDPPEHEILNEKNDEDAKRGIKRRASEAFSDAGAEEFKGFEIKADQSLTLDYVKVLDRLEAEVAAAIVDFTPLKSVMATPPVPVRASKRSRQDTDSSRPSSALSSRSESDAPSTEVAASPGAGRRRTTTEMSSPLLRVPLERGWKRELVYRAALDAHSRRNADIYYYTPAGKKLRSTREVAEQLSGTGLTLENFSFFKEPLGLDDPEKEIIRDAKVMRKAESPVAASVARTPSMRVATPETPKSPPGKLKVKSMGARLSTPPVKAPKRAALPTPTLPTPTPPTAPTADNNNSTAWKKPMNTTPNADQLAQTEQPSQIEQPVQLEQLAQPEQTAHLDQIAQVEKQAPELGIESVASEEVQKLDFKPVATPVTTPVAVPVVAPVVSRPEPPGTPPTQTSNTPVAPVQQSPARVQQPCSMSCGGGRVPSLCCRSCLCLYHPVCVQHMTGTPFLCKNCRGDSAPEPAPHKPPRAAPPVQQAPHNRVTLRMKAASSGGADGRRVWSVAPAHSQAAVRTRTHTLPQSLALMNGRRFIVVPRAVATQPQQYEDKRRTRVTNGSVTPVTTPIDVTSPRRRGRSKVDDTDHFKAFYEKAQELKYDVVVQIFQYVGMRELAACSRVCKLWRTLAATPALWRHVRMKNSHVSDWGGLCALLKRRGTKRLDLRKMLLPQNDVDFWDQFAEHIPTVDTLERIELCRCPARAVEAACGVAGLRGLVALAIRDALLDPAPLAALPRLADLRLKSMAGLALTRDLAPLASLRHLHHLSLTSIKQLGWCACEVIGSLGNLEALELGECTFGAEFGNVLAKLTRLKRLRLERGTSGCAAPALLRSLASMPALTRLELVNFDVKVGFDDALAECKNIQRLLIIPTYVSQSATTNKQVLSGVLRLKETLTHLMWGVTIELLRVTELFIDQCSGGAARRDVGECIPVLKPVPGAALQPAPPPLHGPPQVEILPLPTLQRLLAAQLPHTKLKLLRIPFHATWRQSLNDFQ